LYWDTIFCFDTFAEQKLIPEVERFFLNLFSLLIGNLDVVGRFRLAPPIPCINFYSPLNLVLFSYLLCRPVRPFVPWSGEGCFSFLLFIDSLNKPGPVLCLPILWDVFLSLLFCRRFTLPTKPLDPSPGFSNPTLPFRHPQPLHFLKSGFLFVDQPSSDPLLFFYGINLLLLGYPNRFHCSIYSMGLSLCRLLARQSF